MGLICLNALCYRFFRLFLIYKVSCVSATTTTSETNFNVVLVNRFLLRDEKVFFKLPSSVVLYDNNSNDVNLSTVN